MDDELCNDRTGVGVAAASSEPGADCDTPLFVHVCSTDVVQIDKETVCDADTGTWHYVTWLDGVVQAPTVDSGISCDEPPPADHEDYDECVDGFRNIVFYSVDEAGVRTEVSRIVTTEECGAQPSPVRAVECRDGTRHVVTSLVAPDGAISELEDRDTGEPCLQLPVVTLPPFCAETGEGPVMATPVLQGEDVFYVNQIGKRIEIGEPLDPAACCC